MGRYIHVAGINWGPCVLKHKYHRHWNHGRPQVGFWGILGVLSIEPLLGEVRPEGSITPPPPAPGNVNPVSQVPPTIEVLTTLFKTAVGGVKT